MAVKQGDIRVGVGGWTFEPWRGVFYPKGLPHAQELSYASRKLTAIEINGTYYGTQKPESFRKWARETPDGFVFSVKGPRYTVNRRVLREAGDSIKWFFDSGVLGPLLFVRGRYGHGGRIGYDKEWRSRPEISGGGELIDQGMHLIDLARWFLGDFVKVQGTVATYFWDMPVEDNGFLLLETARDQTAFLHASCTEWKNLFSLEIYGRQGKLEISGLGGSYGTERLAHYEMLPEMGPPPTTIWEYPMADDSWQSEFQHFLEDIRLRRQPDPGIEAAQAALRVVETVCGDRKRSSQPGPRKTYQVARAMS